MITNVDPNQPLKASKINQIIDAINNLYKVSGGDGINVSVTPGGVGLSIPKRKEKEHTSLRVRCKNVRAQPIKRYGAAVIIGSLYVPTDPELSSSGPALSVGYPVSSAEDGNRFVIAEEAIPPGGIGMCAVSGLALSYIRTDVGGGTHAKLVYYPDFQDALSPEDSGQGELLWYGDSGSGNPGIGLVLLGGANAEEPEDPNTANEFTCPVVTELPAVPVASDRIKFVLWGSASTIPGGTGDDTVWWTHSELTRWYPMVYSSLNGTPGA